MICFRRVITVSTRTRRLVAVAATILAGSGCTMGPSASRSADRESTGSTFTTAPPSPASSVQPSTTLAPVTTTLATSAPSQPLSGITIGVDPGHNGQNYAHPEIINAPIWNGRSNEACNTTGTATDSGYTEAQFNWNIAQYLEADLQAEGAMVVLTRTSNDGVGPCVNVRAQILNTANVSIAIHADGGPASGRGFAVLEPVADGPNDNVIASSSAFGSIVRGTYLAETGMPASDYDGVDGIAPRTDLAGTNLTTVPYVLIECGNMRNAVDAALLISPAFQQTAAKALTDAITRYVAQRS